MRFLGRFAIYLALGLVCVLLTSRWWLPAALPRLLAMGSVEVASVERLETGGLRLSNLAVDAEGVRVEVDWVELPSEWRYVRERFFGGWSEASMVRVGQVDVLTAAVGSEANAPADPLYLPQILAEAQPGLDSVERWLPSVVVESVRWIDGGEVMASAQSLGYRDRQLKGAVSLAQLEGDWPLDARFEADAPWRLDFSHSSTGLAGALRVENLGEKVDVEGVLRRADALLEFSASFGDSAWWPLDARAVSDGFALPELRVPLGEGFALDGVRLSRLEALGQGERFSLDLEGEAVVQDGETRAEPVTYALAAEGGLEVIRVEALSVKSEWASLRLSEPLEVPWRQRRFEGDARLQAEFDLSGQQWLDAHGVGRAELAFSSKPSEPVRFVLDVSGLAYGDYAAGSIAAKGDFEGESLQLEALTLKPMGAGEDERLEVSGAVDLGAGALDLKYSALLGANWLNTLIGQSVFAEALALEEGRVSGAWLSPEVRGRIRTVLQLEATEPIELTGAFRWDGAAAFNWSGTAASSGAEITTEAEATMAPGEWSLRIDALRWTDPERPELRLEAPFQVGWLTDGDSLEERLSVSPFTLRGTDMEASGAYDPAGGLELLLTNVSLARVDRWLRADLPSYYVESIACTVTGFRPFINGTVQVAAEERIDEGNSVRLELSAELGARAIQVERVALHFAGDEVLKGQLQLPLRLRMPGRASGERFYEFLGGQLGGQLKGRSSPAFGEWLLASTGVRVEDAMLDMKLFGDVSEPTGHLNLQVREIGLSANFPDVALPRIHDIDLQLQVNERLVDVRTLRFSLNQSAIDASFQMPLDALSDLSAPDPVEWLQTATGTVRLDRWEMENWVDWLPAYLRRSGRLSGSLELKPPLDLAGTLRFEDFGLRPTESLASVDQIGGRIQLADRIVRIDEATARIGGSLVELSGQIDLTDWTQPLWSFDVEGQNVPIRRTTEMILRSDLAIRLAADDAAQAPLLSGHLGLRSSTLLVDFDPLAPRLKKGTNAQPPFFRISEEPFADWRFDLKMVGESFMRVRSPYFKTKLSADLQLKGTFAEPELLGSVNTLEGELHFPGAKFVLEEGEAYIEASRPNEMQLDFSGIAQKASKVIVMEVSQTLQDPLIQFQSTPPMSQGDIVRFLATGSTSGGGVGNIGIYLGQGMLGAGGMNDGFVDRLTVDVGEETSRSGRNTLGVRYELSPSWSVEGEYDVYDAYNADLIWSIFRR